MFAIVHFVDLKCLGLPGSILAMSCVAVVEASFLCCKYMLILSPFAVCCCFTVASHSRHAKSHVFCSCMFSYLEMDLQQPSKNLRKRQIQQMWTGVPAPLLPGTAYQDGAGAPECKGERARGGRGAGEHGVSWLERPSCCWCVIVSLVCHG